MMKSVLGVALVLAFAPGPVEAKGCIKGALVGGVAGHLAHHGVIGALGGCVVGHHIANEKPKPAPADAAQPPPVPRTEPTAPNP